MTERWVQLGGSRRRTIVFLVVGLVVSAVLLWFALSKVSYDQVEDAFKRADWGWFPIAIAVLVVSIWIKAIRWRMLFDEREEMTLGLSFAATNIGGLFNNLLPQRAGELTRVVAVHRGSGISRVETGATIVAERMMDVFAIGVIGLAFWPFFPQARWVTIVEIVSIVAVAGPVLAILAGRGFRTHLPGLVQRLLHKLPRVGHERSHQFTESLAAGTRMLLKPHRLMPIVALSLATWIVVCFALWLVLQMFDFNIDSVPAMALVLVGTSFAVAIPAAPGAVGVFEAAAQASLVVFGLSASDALSFAVVAHLMVFFPFIVLGLIGMLQIRHINKVRLVPWEETPEELPKSPASTT